MSIRTKLIALLAASGFAAGLIPTVAADEQEQKLQPGMGHTAYVDVKIGGKTTRAAESITKLHAEYFAKGWTVIDVEPYVENGDLEGFFVTYVVR